MADPSRGTTAEQPPSKTVHRRPKVREVSSRFMSPLVHSNSTPIPTANRSDFPRSKSVLRRQPFRFDENHVPENNRSLDKLLESPLSTVRRNQYQQRTKLQSRENGESNDHRRSDAKVTSRPVTPMTVGSRIVRSRYKQISNSIQRSNPLNKSSNGCAVVTAATRLLQECQADVGSKLPSISTSRDDAVLQGKDASNDGSSSCPNSPLCVPNTVLRSILDTWSSMADVDKLREERNCSNAGKVAIDCSRSLNFCSSVNVGGGNSLPPHPSIRNGSDSKKGKKVSSHQEDVHSLKMLSNHYLQWRFTNAKAEASMKAQKEDAERKFHSLGGTISDICNRVKAKQIELAVLRRIKTLTTVVEAQMPYLDEWATLEEDYSTSLSSTSNGLLNSSIRIPLCGEVRADAGELKEGLASALKVLDLVGSHIQKFTMKAEEMDTSVSELTKMFGVERILIDECGDLLPKIHLSQVKECSLRSTLIQSCNTNQYQNQNAEHAS